MTTQKHTIQESLRQVFVITRLTSREARRRKVMWLALVLTSVFLVLYATGFHFAYQDFLRQVNQSGLPLQEIPVISSLLLTMGLYVVNFMIVIVTGLTTVGSVSAELDNNTIHAVAAKPIRRWEIILGKWLGHAGLLFLYTLLLTNGVVAIAYVIGGVLPTNPVGLTLVLYLESLTVLSLSMLGSVLFNTLANGVFVFMLYGVAFIGGWVEQIGALFESQTAVNIGIISSFLLPSEALWRYASDMIARSALLSRMDANPFASVSTPSPIFLGYAGIYVVGLLIFAMRRFSQRDF